MTFSPLSCTIIVVFLLAMEMKHGGGIKGGTGNSAQNVRTCQWEARPYCKYVLSMQPSCTG